MNKIEKIFMIISIMFLLWIVASFVDVNLHNNIPGEAQNIAHWNFFKLF